MALPKYPIADMHVFPLTRESGRLTLLRNNDHLLRRFGQLDLLDLAAGEQKDLAIRAEADRFLFAIGGQVALSLLDLRAGSPSHGVRVELALSAEQPQGVLAPFGVACSLVAASVARFIILSTHSEAHPADRAASADELAKYAGVQ
ncbi:MAG TPA: hypothetical protein VF982_05855 [Anaerolineales bacterium]